MLSDLTRDYYFKMVAGSRKFILFVFFQFVELSTQKLQLLHLSIVYYEL